MPSGHKKAVVKQLRSRYGTKWGIKIIPVGVELFRVVSPEITQHVFFNFVRDDMLGLRIQPALGVTFLGVNVARDAISPRHEHTVDGVTGFVFLNDVIDPAARQNGGWLFEANKPLQPALDNFLTFVDETIQSVGFFESLSSIDDYITAVETDRWRFITGMQPYLYALIAKGKIAKAKGLASETRTRMIKSAIDQGLIQRESDTQPYDEILRMPD